MTQRVWLGGAVLTRIVELTVDMRTQVRRVASREQARRAACGFIPDSPRPADQDALSPPRIE